MRSSYTRYGGGKKWEFSPGATDLSNFEAHGTGKIHADGMEMVAKAPVDGGESPAFGRGDTTKTEEAEAFFWLDPRVGDGDGDGMGDPFEGQYQLHVVNEAGRKVEGGLIHQGRIARARKGDPEQSEHGNWGIAFPRQYLMRGNAEIPPGEGYAIGLFLQTKNGEKSFNLKDSDMLAEGYIGEPIN